MYAGCPITTYKVASILKCWGFYAMLKYAIQELLIYQKKKITYWRVPVWFTQGTDYWVPSDFFFFANFGFSYFTKLKNKILLLLTTHYLQSDNFFSIFVFKIHKILSLFFLLCFRCRSFSVAWADHLGLGFSKSWKPALLLLLRIVAARSLSSLAAVAAMGFLQ